MEEEKQTTEVKEERSVSQRMERIEALLLEQVEQGKKSLKSSRVHTAVMIVLVVVIAIGLIMMNTTFQKATHELPGMLASITTLTEAATEDLNTTIGKIEELDFGALNDTIKGISTIRFDVLNDSIKALQDIIKPFAGFMGAFG